MNKKPTWWQLFKIKLGLGVPFIPTENLGRCDEVIIRYKDKFISILEHPETGEIRSLGWTGVEGLSRSSIRDYWTANPPKPKGGE